MSTPEKGQILTANRLRDGIAVFLTRSGAWNDSIDEAALAQEPQAVKGLEARGQEAETACLITGAYLIDAERVEGRIRAVLIRERMRTLGPTVRTDLGKQAEGLGGAFPA